MDLQIETDEDTYRLLKAAVWCLEKFLGLDKQSATKCMRNYYQHKNQELYVDDDFYHHEGPYGVALRAYYIKILNNTSDRDNTFYTWAREHGYYNPPREAMQYLMGNIEDYPFWLPDRSG
jgi:hypothetical protein